MTNYDPKIHHRRSIRLQGYDYTRAGGYFITVVTHERRCLFSEIINGDMRLNQIGKIADDCWSAIPDHFLNVELGTYMIMPNHIHGIIILHGPVGATHASPLPKSLGTIIGSFKSATTKLLQRKPLWQRNYYEHIIRNADDAHRIHLYIESNPANWDHDEENPKRIIKQTPKGH